MPLSVVLVKFVDLKTARPCLNIQSGTVAHVHLWFSKYMKRYCTVVCLCAFDHIPALLSARNRTVTFGASWVATATVHFIPTRAVLCNFPTHPPTQFIISGRWRSSWGSHRVETNLLKSCYPSLLIARNPGLLHLDVFMTPPTSLCTPYHLQFPFALPTRACYNVSPNAPGKPNSLLNSPYRFTVMFSLLKSSQKTNAFWNHRSFTRM